MFVKKMSASVFLTLAAVIAGGSLAGNASAQEIDARELLERMGAEVSGLDSFILSGEAYADAQLGSGHIIENSSAVTLSVLKPDSLHLSNVDTEESKDLYFGGGVLSIYTKSRNFYGQTEIPEGVQAAVNFAMTELGVDAPLLEFIANDMSEILLESADEVQHLGSSLIRGKLYEQVTIRNSEVDIQIWVASKGRTLPGKLVITSKWEGGSPRFVVFMDWNLEPDFTADEFEFVPPSNATEIKIIAAQ